jgi:hypothetical protein
VSWNDLERRRIIMKKAGFIRLAVAALLVPGLALAGDMAAKVDHKAAFETLKGLAGQWEGEGAAGEHRMPAKTVFEVTSNGTVVLEKMFPGTDHEMLNAYHLVNGELVATHYCSSATQPRMKLDLERSKPGDLVFAFDGGTNFDPKKDGHIHGARLILKDGSHLDSEWDSWDEGKSQHTLRMTLARAGGR